MTRYKNTSFLVELLISILVFTIACAVLFQVFTAALLMSQETKDVGQANARIATLFETLRNAEVAQVYPNAIEQSGGFYVLYFDGTWKETTEEEAAYSLVFQLDDQGGDFGTTRQIRASVLAYRTNFEETKLLDMETTWYRPL
jgi:type II secretory pathway pseudopilin PulG